MFKKVLLAPFQPVMTRFGPWKTPKSLDKGPFWDQKWVKNGSKARLAKRDMRPFGVLVQFFRQF